ncbi:hypothetical protein NMY22_g12210 [Coprinellus aureogranulatus]|nr:hypothetical protein NMY22_g12210 [Coprinellus aureogranulatus]
MLTPLCRAREPESWSGRLFHLQRLEQTVHPFRRRAGTEARLGHNMVPIAWVRTPLTKAVPVPGLAVAEPPHWVLDWLMKSIPGEGILQRASANDLNERCLDLASFEYFPDPIPGNIVDLSGLNILALRKENYVPEVLDINLAHISQTSPPPRPRPHAQPEENNAVFLNELPRDCLSAVASVKQGLYMVLSKCPDYHAAVQKIRPHLRTIIDDWLETSLWCPYPVEDNGTSDGLMDPTTMCLVLMKLISLGPEVRNEVLGADGIIKFALGACAIRKQSGRPFQTQSWAQGHCPIALVLWHVLDYSEDNRQKVFDVLCGHSKESRFLVTRIVENMYMRCQYISQQTRDSILQNEGNSGFDTAEFQSGPTTAFVDLDTILSIVATLCQQPTIA